MSFVYLVLGILCGILAFFLGDKLAKKTQRPLLKGLVHVTPLAVLCWTVIIIDVFFF